MYWFGATGQALHREGNKVLQERITLSFPRSVKKLLQTLEISHPPLVIEPSQSSPSLASAFSLNLDRNIHAGKKELAFAANID